MIRPGRWGENPVLEMEVRLLSRSPRAPVVLAAYGAVLAAAATAWVWSAGFAGAAQLDRGVFWTLGIQLGVIMGVALIPSTAAISTERQRGGLGMLLGGSLRSRQVLAGKVGAIGLAILVLIALALPLAASLALSAGMTAGQVLAAQLILAVGGAAAASLGVLASTWFIRGATAMLAGYAGCLALFLLTAVPAMGANAPGLTALNPWLFANPFLGLRALTEAPSLRFPVLALLGGGRSGPLMSPWQLAVLVQALVAGLGLAIANARLSLIQALRGRHGS